VINWYLNTWSKVVEFLESNSEEGLSPNEIDERRKKWGENKIRILYDTKVLNTSLKYFLNRWFLLPLTLFIYGVYIGRYFSSIILIIVPLAVVYFKINKLQLKKKELKALSDISYGQAVVIRDGFPSRINSEELVIGDIVDIRPGVTVPADIRLIKSENLKVNEKSLTGEDFISDKYETKLDYEVSNLAEIKNVVFKGTVTVSGRAKGIVVSTGNYTQLGRIMNMLTSTNIRKETIDEKAELYWNKTLSYSFLVGAVLSLIGVIIKGVNYEFIYNVLLSSLSFGGIIIFLLFFRHIKKITLQNDVHILNHSWFDVVNDIEILFIDKTGSISKNEMHAKKIYTDEKLYDIDDIHKENLNFNRMMEIGLIANNATYNTSEDKGTGDIREIALLKLAAIKKVYKGSIDSQNRRIFDMPMDFNKRIYTSVNKMPKGYRANVTGNVDELLDYCTFIMKDGIEVELSEEDKTIIREKDYELSKDGLVTMGIGYRSFNYEPSAKENIESNMVFVGIIGLENPIVDGIEELIIRLRKEKILPILITEDNKIAATTVAKKVGIIDDDSEVISGIELLNATKEEKIDVLSKTRVFSKIAPELKNFIFTIFKEDNYKISSTGEEIVDLPLLTLSNLSIAKGKASSLVKKVADLYIKEDCLEKLIYLKNLSRTINLLVDRGVGLYWIFILSQGISLSLGYIMFNRILLDEFSLLILNVIILPFIVFYSIVKNEIRELTQESIAVRISIVVFVLLVSSFVIGNMEYNSVILPLISAATMFLVSLEYTIPKILSRK